MRYNFTNIRVILNNPHLLLHFEVVKIRKEIDHKLTYKSIKHLAVELIKGEMCQSQLTSSGICD